MNFSTQFPRANASRRLLALFTIAAVASVPAAAMNRSARLHAASHPAGHIVAARSEARQAHKRRSVREEAAPAHGARRGSKANSHPEQSRSNARDAKRKRREPEMVDEPITMRRASARGRTLTRRERERELAEQRHPAPAYHHARTGRVQERAVADSRYTKPRAVDDRAADARYASDEYQASYANTRRGVEEAVRPNAYNRHLPSKQNVPDIPRTGGALRSTSGIDSTRSALGVGQHLDEVYTNAAPDLQAEQALRSSVVVRRPAPMAQVSAADASPQPFQRYAPHVITGFGAEVAPAPVVPRSKSNTSLQQATEAQDLGEDLAANGTPSVRTLAENAMEPLVTPLYTRNGNLMMPAPLRGSHEILVHQNTMADHDGLERIRDDEQLNRLRAQHLLVSFPEIEALRVNTGLPENRRYARPWTVKFAADAARAFYRQFGEPLQVNSAVRTVSYQLRLQRTNGNAAAVRGDGASPHLTGQAIDLAKRGMSADEIAWMRTYLAPFIEAGKVDVEEEFQQACFHISVYRAYSPAVSRQALQVAQLHSVAPAAASPVRESEDTDR